MDRPERREHRRLGIPLPLEYRPAADPSRTCRTVTSNVSTGGLMFEAIETELRPGDQIELYLTVPPGNGHLPYESRATAIAEVLRVNEVFPEGAPAGKGKRLRVAARFRSPLCFTF